MHALTHESIHEKLKLAHDFEFSEESERQKLEQLWQAGHLHRHLDSLEAFYRQKRQEFQSFLTSNPESSDLVELAKLLVIENGIVDRIAETLDQIKEIESEIWIQGERGNHDRARIVSDWAKDHAKRWRQWRIKEYLYAVERMASRLPNCISMAS